MAAPCCVPFRCLRCFPLPEVVTQERAQPAGLKSTSYNEIFCYLLRMHQILSETGRSVSPPANAQIVQYQTRIEYAVVGARSDSVG